MTKEYLSIKQPIRLSRKQRSEDLGMAETLTIKRPKLPDKPRRKYTYNKCKCNKCGRKILVERILSGNDNTSGIIVTCGFCIMTKGLDKTFKIAHPEAAKDIERWISEP